MCFEIDSNFNINVNAYVILYTFICIWMHTHTTHRGSLVWLVFFVDIKFCYLYKIIISFMFFIICSWLLLLLLFEM